MTNQKPILEYSELAKKYPLMPLFLDSSPRSYVYSEMIKAHNMGAPKDTLYLESKAKMVNNIKDSSPLSYTYREMIKAQNLGSRPKPRIAHTIKDCENKGLMKWMIGQLIKD